MRPRSQSRRLGGASPGTGGTDRLPTLEGMMTRARRRRCGQADLLPLACTRRRGESVRPRKRPRRVKEWRNWANLTSDIFRDVAGRLCSDSPWPAAQYNHLRRVCKAWRDTTDDLCSLDILFRPRGWTTIREPQSCRLRHDSGLRIHVQHAALSSNYIFALAAEGLLVLRDKQSANVVRLLNPLTGRLTEFPPITEVRAYDGSEPKSRQAIDALKLYFSDPKESRYFAGIDDTASPPNLVFCVHKDNGPSHVVYAKPGDQHWVSVHNLAGCYMCSDVGRIACYFRPPPEVCMPKKIYMYPFGFWY